MATSSAPLTLQTQVEETDKPQTLVLKLNVKNDRRVKWDESVRDSRPNMKTSKKCCVFHKRREFGESDSGMFYIFIYGLP